MPDATQAQVRARVGSIGFPGARADTKVEKLSGGGEGAPCIGAGGVRRPASPDPRRTDEPLDIESRAALIEGLNTYEGAVILSSHDRYLLEACADRLWLVANGTVAPYEGDMEEYRRVILETASGGTEAKGRRGEQSTKAERRQEAARARAQLAPLKRVAEVAEAKVNQLTERLRDLDTRLSAPGLFEKNAAQATQLTKERGMLAKSIEEAEAKWMAAEEDYEAAKGRRQRVMRGKRLRSSPVYGGGAWRRGENPNKCHGPRKRAIPRTIARSR